MLLATITVVVEWFLVFMFVAEPSIRWLAKIAKLTPPKMDVFDRLFITVLIVCLLNHIIVGAIDLIP